ncbi:ADP-ribosylation factor (ARF) GTPase activating protein (GAP) effector, putative [Candida dubliniensis CD36]|uniref:Protein AGE2 homologue n=1 Tax=Candida dubliniensis (strain CD36 / ATCC MYA-646 / CBS 7987 / NCPF 3949 / NRRL Y-17841) TaxID=573826 RepID=B9WCM3_CANDC|nr:ADP-ribosylation factor (ARF) GTPase activating protein (GAP) effector, putative [Candida dubliniensis CD36]CAX44146.1 ADP-ribosylation factor (ARF) GTPase activating protein (GAP) effector, putative [Candida dubliniensis CD36]
MALPSSKKTHSEQHKQILKQLLKEDANKTCADCKVSKNPRWASWNLGCFICIRCSGIHRSMGTHISKVKSVDLDAWTDDQIENMVKWGNSIVNQYWEDKLPSGYIPDQSKIENFIRTKYDLRKWTMSKNLPDPLSLNKNKAGSTATTSGTQQPKHETKSHSNTTLSNDINLLDTNSNKKSSDEEFGSFTVTRSPHKRSTKLAPPPTKTVLPAAPTTPGLQQQQQQPLQSAQNTGGSVSSMGRPDLKKSILSLYASPSSSNSFIQQQQQQSLGMNSLSNSLSSLNIQGGNSTSNNNVYRSSNPVNTPNNHNQRHPLVNSTPSLNNNQSKQNWNNEWTTDTFTSSPSIPSSSSSSLAGTSNYKTTSSLNVNGLDDDLFKNVWG